MTTTLPWPLPFIAGTPFSSATPTRLTLTPIRR
jgi:hypothetical protein